MSHGIRWALLALLALPGRTDWAAPAPSPVPTATATDAEPDATPVDPAVERCRTEATRARDAWDKSRLESSVYEKRFKRAYDRWVKAAKAEKARALAKRDRASDEFKLSIERRRLAWYGWEAAKARQAAAEAAFQTRSLAQDIRRVEDRIRTMEKGLGITPTPTAGKTP